MAPRLPCLDHGGPFPPVSRALRDPNGLLAFGGDLGETRLLDAYRHGIFPWFSEGEPILWWSPDPRAVFIPGQVHVSRSLRRFIRHCNWQLTLNRAFPAVISQCAAQPRHGQNGTWITEAVRQAYIALHRRGHAHSIEAWQDGELIGGLYGPAIGGAFFGESMFSRRENASRVVLVALSNWLAAAGYQLLDAQMPTPHLRSMGVLTLSRADYLQRLKLALDVEPACNWQAQLLPEQFWRPALADTRVDDQNRRCQNSHNMDSHNKDGNQDGNADEH